MSDFASLPADLPMPEDDGAADHLPGLELPSVSLPVAGGGPFDFRGNRGRRDGPLELRDALGLPTFDVHGTTLYKRLTFVAESGRIEKVFYPVFPPDRNAKEVERYLKSGRPFGPASRLT